jgi:hypothetical protein
MIKLKKSINKSEKNQMKRQKTKIKSSRAEAWGNPRI